MAQHPGKQEAALIHWSFITHNLALLIIRFGVKLLGVAFIKPATVVPAFACRSARLSFSKPEFFRGIDRSGGEEGED